MRAIDARLGVGLRGQSLALAGVTCDPYGLRQRLLRRGDLSRQQRPGARRPARLPARPTRAERRRWSGEAPRKDVREPDRAPGANRPRRRPATVDPRSVSETCPRLCSALLRSGSRRAAAAVSAACSPFSRRAPASIKRTSKAAGSKRRRGGSTPESAFCAAFSSRAARSSRCSAAAAWPKSRATSLSSARRRDSSSSLSVSVALPANQSSPREAS